MKMNVIAVLAVILVSCENRSTHKMEVDEEVAVADETLLSNFDIAATSTPNRGAKAVPGKDSKIFSSDRKLIKNGAFSFETTDIEKTKREIINLCLEFNGYVATENHKNYADKLQYDQILRLPASRFDSFIEKFYASGYHLDEKNISTQDVTEEFIDVEARLKTKKDLEARYQDLLKFAKTVEEMLSIENQIGNVRSDIESMEGRLLYLKNQVALSTISLSYYEVTGVDFGFASKFVTALKNGWDKLMILVVALASLWPFIILIGGVVYALIRRKKIKLSES